MLKLNLYLIFKFYFGIKLDNLLMRLGSDWLKGPIPPPKFIFGPPGKNDLPSVNPNGVNESRAFGPTKASTREFVLNFIMNIMRNMKNLHDDNLTWKDRLIEI